MSTTETEDDAAVYQAYFRDHDLDPAKINRGHEARRQRMEAAVAKRLTVRLDEDVIKELQQLIMEGQTYEQVVNGALREWLAAGEMKELVREELQHAFQQAMSATQAGSGLPQSQIH